MKQTFLAKGVLGNLEFMKVLVLIHEYPPIGGGGGAVAESIANELIALGEDICVLSSNVAEGSLPNHAHQKGVNLIRVPTRRKELHRATFFEMVSYLISGFFAAKKLLKNWKPDIIHVHFAVPAGVLAWVISKLYNIPYAITIHLGDVPGGAPEKTKKWFQWIFPFTKSIWGNASRIVAVSNFTKELALESYPFPIDVIPNGIKLGNMKSKNIVVGEVPKIIFAGRFVEQKNPIQLVRVLGKVSDLSWECLMLGNGPLFENTMNEIEDQGLQKRISLPGWVNPERVQNELEKSDILFMPSLTEGMPIIGIEALAEGLAIVASHSFSDLVVENENGYTYPSDDYDGMEAGLRYLLNDGEKLLKARNKSLEMSADFDIKIIAQRYKDLFYTYI